MPHAYPLEFRRDVVAVARRKEAPMSLIAKDFGISETCLQRWVRRAEIEDGVREGLTLAELAEIRELKRRKPPARAGERGPAAGRHLPGTGRPPKMTRTRTLCAVGLWRAQLLAGTV